MGPWHLEWYRNRGLTLIREIQPSETLRTHLSKYINKAESSRPLNDTITVEDVTEYWSGGRIDVSDGSEIALPVMHSNDWYEFTKWLKEIRTDTVYTLDQLITLYEKTNTKIRWAKDRFELDRD